jgi:hypothetical protein
MVPHPAELREENQKGKEGEGKKRKRKKNKKEGKKKKTYQDPRFRSSFPFYDFGLSSKAPKLARRF